MIEVNQEKPDNSRVIYRAFKIQTMLSVIIITKNEEQKIRACLESVWWADEIVVVDSGSTDNTVRICQEFTDVVVQSGWSGFGAQKNKALAMAKHEWVLSLDADERVGENLRAEIISVIKNPCSKAAWNVPRKSRYCGRVMNHCGWYPDYVLRLFKKDSARFSDDLVHEKVIAQRPVGKLRNPITHHAVDNLEQSIEKMNLYSTLAAQDKFNKGEKSSLCKACLRGIWTFVRIYLFRLGFLDGAQGLMLSLANAQGTYYKYAKLTRLHRDAEQSAACSRKL